MNLGTTDFSLLSLCLLAVVRKSLKSPDRQRGCAVAHDTQCGWLPFFLFFHLFKMVLLQSECDRLFYHLQVLIMNLMVGGICPLP
jgi:hypothetical protein